MSGWLQLHVATRTFTFLTPSTNSEDAACVSSLSAPAHPEITPHPATPYAALMKSAARLHQVPEVVTSEVM